MKTALGIVYDALDVVNGTRSEDEQLPKAPNVPLAGEGGTLDSLGLVTLVLAIERGAAAIAGTGVSLLDDNAVDPSMSAYRTPSSIASLLVERLGG
ncbi:MAG TPA: hypothetical protein VGL13_17250 [Polyangiaceae bacterium]|jgi:hypothetical protein